MTRSSDDHDPVVITGIGLIASTGLNREEVWASVRAGRSGVRRLDGIPCIPDGLLIGAPVGVESAVEGTLKVIELCHLTAEEALYDADLDWDAIDRDRFGCAISGHMGDTHYVAEQLGVTNKLPPHEVNWWQQWLPNTACVDVANRFGLYGPRICHSTACASGLIDFLTAVRSIQDNQCDLALAGSAEAFHPLFAAGFLQMRVLAHDADPKRACRPFDSTRDGFVMGEGSAMFVLERLSHALERGANIYAEVAGGKTLADAHHVTGLDLGSEALAHLISATLDRANLRPEDVGYINAHGTGTQQNDIAETRAIRRAFGQAANQTCVSSVKAMLGHLVNAAGSVELAITALAMRDGFVPPTLNLRQPDPQCDLDCIPLVGRDRQVVSALKLSVAFGGHMAAIALRRIEDVRSRFKLRIA